MEKVHVLIRGDLPNGAMSSAVELATSQATGETSLGVLICCRSVRANKAATIKQGHSVPWSNPWCDWAEVSRGHSSQMPGVMSGTGRRTEHREGEEHL